MKRMEIIELGEQLLNMNPDLVPKFRIIRDVLKFPQTDNRYIEAKQGIPQSKWVKELAEEQWENGSWGRFYTQDTKVKQKIITTEWALRRALELGLDKNDGILKRAVSHMESMLNGVELPLDREEHHYGFRIAFAYLIAANLSMIDSDHPLLDLKRKYCAECTIRAFQLGQFDERDWKKAYMEMNEVMLQLFMIHPLLLLQSKESILPDEIEMNLLQRIWNRPEGIYYITNQCPANYQDIQSGSFHYWLLGIELLSNFRHCSDFAAGAISWLLDQRGEDGFWDYGQDASKIVFGHYSESWKNQTNRKIDCSTIILALIRKFTDRCIV